MTAGLKFREWAKMLFKPKRYKVAFGGRGCLHPDALIDTPNGQTKISEFKGGDVYSWHNGKIVVAQATPSKEYTEEDLYQVVFEDGRSIIATDEHKFLTTKGWVYLKHLSSSCGVVLQRQKLPSCLHHSSWELSPSKLPVNVQHCLKKHEDCQDDCFLYRRQYGRQPLHELNNDLAFLPLQGDEPQHNRHVLSGLDGQDSVLKNSPLLLLSPLSTLVALLEVEAQCCEDKGIRNEPKTFEQPLAFFLLIQLYLLTYSLVLSFQKSLLHSQCCDSLQNQDENLSLLLDIAFSAECDNLPFENTSLLGNDFIISKVRLIHKHSRQKYWDLHVFKTNNYLSNGIVNHNSGKSWTYTDALLAKALSEKIGVLCAREFQNSMSESVHKLLTQRIEDLGFSQYFEIQRDVIRCTLTKSEFIFKGLRNNVESLKSLSGIDICWIEEAQVISQESLDILIPTIRKPNSEIWFTMNPRLTDDPVYKQFVLTDDPDVYKARVNYTENKHFPEVLELERRRMLERDPALYNHIWLGECLTHTDAQVFKDKWEVREFTPDKWDLPFYGMDFGFSQDPTACVKVWLHNETLYIEKEAVKVGLELDDTADYIKQFIPEIENGIIRADCARPESISYLKRHGLPRIQAVKKWSGSVEDGITHMKSYKSIVVHPRCTHTIKEMMLYSYKVDQRSGDITTAIVDKHNHVIDACRYGLEPLMKRKFTFVDAF
jgi:phage terminase large subunit